MDTANTTTLNDSIIGVLSQPITLAAQGDFIRLEFTFRYTNAGTAAANAAGFRFGIENSNGTPVTADNQTSISDNDQGYYAQTGVGTVAPLSTNTLYRESGGTFPILGGIDRTNLATNSAGAAFNDNNAHTVSFSITRTAGNNISLSLIYDGGTPITNTTTSGTGNFFTFDEIAFSNGFVTSPVSFNLDNITITSVPEPATMGLTSFGAVGMLGLVRGRRR
jgi:hypothetical protein